MELEISDTFQNSDGKKYVSFPVEWFVKLLTEFKSFDGRMGTIDFYSVQELFLRLLELVGEERRIVVLDNGGTICFDRKRIEGLTQFQQEVVAYIAYHHCATADELLEAVWHKPDGRKNLVSKSIYDINLVFMKQGFPFHINQESTGAYKFYYDY